MGIPLAKQRSEEYPHQFSGGMRQRAMIAMAMSCKPKILIADEPTTALDVTIQAQIFELIEELKRLHNTAVILITHDMGVVAELADHVAVMYMGNIVEQGTVDDVLRRPAHPYTEALLRSIPSPRQRQAATNHPDSGFNPRSLRPSQGMPVSHRVVHTLTSIVKPSPVHSLSVLHTMYSVGTQQRYWINKLQYN